MTKQAVILIDHGSADPSSCAQLAHLAAIIAGRVGLAVYPAHMSVAAPTVAEALAAAVADGADDIIVAPCFFGAGRHVTVTIPDLLAEAAALHSGVTLRMADPLGFDPALADPIVMRIRPHVSRRELP